MHPTHNPLYTLDPEGHIDRRKMIYRNAPTQETTQANNKIKYNPENNEWECLQSGRKENTHKTKET